MLGTWLFVANTFTQRDKVGDSGASEIGQLPRPWHNHTLSATRFSLSVFLFPFHNFPLYRTFILQLTHVFSLRSQSNPCYIPIIPTTWYTQHPLSHRGSLKHIVHVVMHSLTRPEYLSNDLFDLFNFTIYNPILHKTHYNYHTHVSHHSCLF